MKSIAAGILLAGIIVLGAISLFSGSGKTEVATSAGAGANVVEIDGKQIVTIKVKGGYQPQTSTVKAGVPTTLRFETSGTFDCSSVISIPSLGISQSLPPTGSTDIAVGTLQAGTLHGTCGMGMYRFDVEVRG